MNPIRKGRHGLMAAVVLGTALAALGPTTLNAAEPSAIADISRYCTACWRNARLPADCWTDCTQDVFIRLMERVTPAAWSQVLAGDGAERREFIRAIDAVKKRNQRSRKFVELQTDQVAARPLASAAVEERSLVEQTAGQILSSRQQHILRRSFEGYSVDEIARELCIGPERVSDEKYKAIRKLRQHLASAEATKPQPRLRG